MSEIGSLQKIKEHWLNRVTNKFARGAGIKESFRDQLIGFYDLLNISMESGNPNWMRSILDDWVASRPETDNYNESSLQPFLGEVEAITFEIIKDTLSSEDALNLILLISPIFFSMIQYVSNIETERFINNSITQATETKGLLEKLDKSKSEFISIAAHELKTPLTLIDGYTDMLAEHIIIKNQSGADIYLHGIKQGAQRLRGIIDDMIDVSLIDNRMLLLNFQPYWLNRLIEYIVYEAETKIKERELLINYSPVDGWEEMVYGDEERLVQAFRNILDNAIKFTPDGGTIDISGRILPGFFEISITDTGIGVDPEDQTRIFEKFGQTGNITLHSSGKLKFKGGGPGLGLPISKGIIEAHGGTIWVESEGYNESKCPGSTFHVMLPVYSQPPIDKSDKLFELTKNLV